MRHSFRFRSGGRLKGLSGLGPARPAELPPSSELVSLRLSVSRVDGLADGLAYVHCNDRVFLL